MLSFSSQQKRQEVQRLFTSRINQSCLSNINPRDRAASRSAFCEVVWAIPCGRTGKPDFNSAFPVVSKDISAKGLALIHSEPITSDPLLIGLQDQTGPCFVRCALEHCTALGYGFYQIGLHPDEVVSVREDELAKLKRQLEKFSHATTCAAN
jgi:hypothetical protein